MKSINYVLRKPKEPNQELMLKALQVIELISLYADSDADGVIDSPISKIYRLSHAALGRCDVHDDWVKEIEDLYASLDGE